LHAPSSRRIFQNGLTPSPLPALTTSRSFSALMLLCSEPPARPMKWALSDLAALESSLKAITISPPPLLPTTHSLDGWFKTNLDRVPSQFGLQTSLKRVTFRSKPWWSELWSMLRKAYNSALGSS